MVKWRQIAESVSQIPTTSTRQPGERVVGRIHYLGDRGMVAATVAYSDSAALERQARICLNSGKGIVVETPEQQERIQQSREARSPAQAQVPPEPEDEMEC